MEITALVFSTQTLLLERPATPEGEGIPRPQLCDLSFLFAVMRSWPLTVQDSKQRDDIYV